MKKSLKMSAEKVMELAQFVQVTRKAMEEQFGNYGVKLLELDLGISGNRGVVILPGAERYFIKGSVLKAGTICDFRTDFAMALGDTTLDTVAALVNDCVSKVIVGF